MPTISEKVGFLSKLICLAVLPFFLGCAKGHISPAAELGYLGLERAGNFDLYEVKFSSDVDFLHVFEKGKQPISSSLLCSLGVDEVAGNHTADQYLASGLVYLTQPVHDGEALVYSSALSFYENINEGRSRRALSAEELQHILKDRSFVPCVYMSTAFGFKAYRSATLRLPVADIFREMGI